LERLGVLGPDDAKVALIESRDELRDPEQISRVDGFEREIARGQVSEKANPDCQPKLLRCV
jgi:hypothetical protein